MSSFIPSLARYFLDLEHAFYDLAIGRLRYKGWTCIKAGK